MTSMLVNTVSEFGGKIMTIAISIKVNDGVVLAADSASTMYGTDSQGKSGIINVYENANKVANLHKNIPVGIITWGVGSIGKASISTLIKDFRKRIMGKDGDYTGWKIDVNDYTVKDISGKFKEFIYDDLYSKEFLGPKNPELGFIIAGYSAKQSIAEEWRINIGHNSCIGPSEVRPIEECGISWNGMPEPISRLYFGCSPKMENVLKDCKINDAKIKEIINKIKGNLIAPMVFDPMPIQDAIDLGGFLVDLTKNYYRFVPGAPSVGGPIEIAAITKHEGYKWITRKFYFDDIYNPKGE